MKTDDYIFKSSSLLTFIYKYFFPIMAFVALFQTGAPYLYSIPVVILLLNLLFVSKVKVYEDKIVIYRTLFRREYGFGELKLIFQTRFFAPKLCIFTLNSESFLRKFVIFLPLPRDSDILLIRREEIVEFLKKKKAEQLGESDAV